MMGYSIQITRLPFTQDWPSSSPHSGHNPVTGFNAHAFSQADILQNARIILANRKQVDVNEISPLEAYNWLDAWVLGQELGVEL